MKQARCRLQKNEGTNESRRHEGKTCSSACLQAVVVSMSQVHGENGKNARYRNPGAHTESSEVVFDSTKTVLRTRLELVFQAHDPTAKNHQRDDCRTSSRSAMVYIGYEQKQIARHTMEDVDCCWVVSWKRCHRSKQSGDLWKAETERHDFWFETREGTDTTFQERIGYGRRGRS